MRALRERQQRVDPGKKLQNLDPDFGGLGFDYAQLITVAVPAHRSSLAQSWQHVMTVTAR